ncbi:MAG: hypothetical protein KatS3mg015_2903 [Fimbriimonadales bacterium]|nr:MAG: hypothetical protein KatS3mg015_2903 [Fimbriimonadales bacterium]
MGPLAWQYDDAYHCPECTAAWFRRQPRPSWPHYEVVDEWGRPPRPVHVWYPDCECDALVCATCGEILRVVHACGGRADRCSVPQYLHLSDLRQIPPL